MAYNFVTTQSKLILITSGTFIRSQRCSKISAATNPKTIARWKQSCRMDDNRGQSDMKSEQKGSPHGMVNSPSIVAGVVRQQYG